MFTTRWLRYVTAEALCQGTSMKKGLPIHTHRYAWIIPNSPPTPFFADSGCESLDERNSVNPCGNRNASQPCQGWGDVDRANRSVRNVPVYPESKKDQRHVSII